MKFLLRLFAAALLMMVTLAWAETIQMVQYYAFPPVTLTDPFHVRRLTVGVPYLTVNNPPTDSAIVAGQLLIKTTALPSVPAAPTIPIEIGSNAAGNQVRLAGAGANKSWDFNNNAGALRVLAVDLAGNPVGERLRILNRGFAGILPDRDSRAPLELGPRDTAAAGGQLLWREAGANSDFRVENISGQYRLLMQDGANESARISSDGKMGIFFSGVGVADPPTALYLGPRDTSTLGGKILLSEVGSATDSRYCGLQNTAGTLELYNQIAGNPDKVRMKITSLSQLTLGDQAPDPGSNERFHVVGNVFVGTSGNPTKMGIGTASPSVLLHMKGDTGLLIEGPPATGKTAYAFQAVVNGAQTDLRIGYEEGSTGTAHYNLVLHPDGSGGVHIGVNIASPAYPLDVGMDGNDAANFGETAEFGKPSLGGSLGSDNMLVRGSGYATGGYFTTCSVQSKTDLLRVTPADEQGLLGHLTQMPLYRFHYKDTDRGRAEHIGILAEEAPEAMADSSGDRLSSDSAYLAVLHAAIKAQRAQIESLKSQVDRLEKELEGGAKL